MCIIAKKNKLSKSFWLYFHIKESDGTEWIEHRLPIPTILLHINKGVFIGWAIEGFFATKNNQEFLNDIIARFLITFKEQDIQRLGFKPNLENIKNAHINENIYSLKDFSKQLKSFKKKKYIPKRADNYPDYTFWAIKLYAEDMIRETGFIVYDSLESWALSQFINKEKSTIRAKCRSVFFWYESRDFKLTNSQTKKYDTIQEWYEDSKMTRQEHMQKVSRDKKEKNRRKVINLITGLYANDYKKKNGKWHYIKIAEATNLSRYTVSTILKEIEKDSK